jgi:hypothetical protein
LGRPVDHRCARSRDLKVARVDSYAAIEGFSPNRRSWAPNGDDDVANCAALKPSTGLWRDKDCDDARPFVCEGDDWAALRAAERLFAVAGVQETGFRTLEASLSVEFQSIRLLLGPLIISARVLEIETQTLLASTRTKSC